MCHTKEIGVTSVFEKKFSRETEKKIQFLCIQDYIMHTKKIHAKKISFGKCFLSTKFDLRMKKKTKQNV